MAKFIVIFRPNPAAVQSEHTKPSIEVEADEIEFDVNSADYNFYSEEQLVLLVPGDNLLYVQKVSE